MLEGLLVEYGLEALNADAGGSRKATARIRSDVGLYVLEARGFRDTTRARSH